MRAWPRLGVALAASLLGCSPSLDQSELQRVTYGADALDEAELAPLARAIGDRRIVLLGENGHGVAQFTTAKVRIIEWLHRDLGFDVVVMESGFFECGHAWDGASGATPRSVLYQCLKYPFQQAEILPLFEFTRERQETERPLELAGMDIQPQGFDSGQRPATLHASLSARDPELARRVAAYDSALFLVADSGGLGEEVYPWILRHGDRVRAAYDSAAALADGRDRWAFRLAGGLVDRLLVQARAMNGDTPGLPASFYQLRDEWMARAVAAIADSIDGRRKVVVWLHNDHARYGDFETDGNEVRSVGGFLREWHGEDVFSMGFFMGGGVIADNGRREREVLTPAEGGIERFLGAAGHDAGYLLLTGNRDPEVLEWASGRRPYLRMGLDPREMVPLAEFDALFYIDRVTPPDYSIAVRR